MNIMKKYIIFMIISLGVTICNINYIWAEEIEVFTFSDLEYEVKNTEEPITIIIDEDIEFTKPLEIKEGKDIIIKSGGNYHCKLIVKEDFKHFIISYDAKLTLENIYLYRASVDAIDINDVIYNKGEVILRTGVVITNLDNINDNNELSNDHNNKSNTNDFSMNLATMVITWSGFALTFITLIAGILGIFGFRELRDLQKSRNEVKELHEKFEIHIKNITELEKSTEVQLEKLTRQFEEDAQSIMQATYYFTLGSNAYTDANYHDAIKYIEKSLKYLPRSTDSLCLIGRAYTIVEKTETSDEYFYRALAIDPDCAAAYRGLAALHRHKNLDKALEYAKIAVNKESQNTEYLNYLGQLLRDKNMLYDALQVFIKSDTLRRHPDTDFFLSILYLAEGLFGRARFHINNSIEQYDNVDEFKRSKPVWKELARWVAIFTGNEDNNDIINRALKQLNEVAKVIDTERTKLVVLGHIRFLLTVLKMDDSYIIESYRRINGNDET